MRSVRVLVHGASCFDFPQHVNDTLSAVHERVGIDLLIENERGVARDWGIRNGVVIETYEANRKIFMERAGCIRNAVMLKTGKPTVAIIFSVDDEAIDMINKLVEAGIPAMVSCWSDGPGSTLNWKQF